MQAGLFNIYNMSCAATRPLISSKIAASSLSEKNVLRVGVLTFFLCTRGNQRQGNPAPACVGLAFALLGRAVGGCVELDPDRCSFTD